MLDGKNARERDPAEERHQPGGGIGGVRRVGEGEIERAGRASRSAKRSASPRWTVARRPRRARRCWPRSAVSDGGLSSTNVGRRRRHGTAPRGRGRRCRRRGRAPGRPAAPSARMLIHASRTRSAVGRTRASLGGTSRRPRTSHDAHRLISEPGSRESWSRESGAGLCHDSAAHDFRDRLPHAAAHPGACGDSAQSRACSVVCPFHSLDSSRNAASTNPSPSQGTRSAHWNPMAASRCCRRPACP